MYHFTQCSTATYIQQLIRNMDEELQQLCKTHSIPLSEVPHILQFGLCDNNNPNGSQELLNARYKMELRLMNTIYKGIAQEALRKKNIFIVYGNYEDIRQALLQRGWIEKLPPYRFAELQALSLEKLIEHASEGNAYQIVALSKMVDDFPAHFIWQPEHMQDSYSTSGPYRNRIRHEQNEDFTKKFGLIGCSEQQMWHRKDGVAQLRCPRAYRIYSGTAEIDAFIDDFRQTQCRNLIQHLWDCLDNPYTIIDEKKGTISESVAIFAILNLKKQLKKKTQENISTDISINSVNIEWENFIKKSNNLIHKTAKLKMNYQKLMEIAENGILEMQKIEDKYAEYRSEGLYNTWIVKPGCESCGFGIIVSRNMHQILRIAENNPDRFYIVQKYIERPLLIYGTKFDIRAYMLLLINDNVLTIWLYKDCYLRFSSQQFNLKDLGEQIHLTNYTVQKRYNISKERDERLPHNNMWSLEAFKSYLKSIKLANIWQEKIFPSMGENLNAVVMASCDQMKFIDKSFQLYGCDFMLDENFNPILIEINSTPDLTPSTTVTGVLCPRVQKDLIKVVLDLSISPQASVGDFHQIHKINFKNTNVDPNLNLIIKGQKMPLNNIKKRKQYNSAPFLQRLNCKYS